MTSMRIRDVDLNVKVVGQGPPLVLMHGGPGGDLYTLLSFRQCKDQFTLVFYDHRCNGRSTGVPVESFTWENLTADAEALREALGFSQWAVMGHSFGGQVALEYALRYPNSLSQLVLLDTGGEARWSMENASKVLAERGYSPEIVDLAHRWLNGDVPPNESFRVLMKLGKAYNPHSGIRFLAREMRRGAWRSRLRPAPLVYAAHHLLPGWTVMDRLGEINVPTLVMAGEDDFIFPPEHQAQLAAGLPHARLRLIECAGHNPHDERTAEVMDELRAFIRHRSEDSAG
jgi:pimeloyl-ACP methyl ester carboxylesterase